MEFMKKEFVLSVILLFVFYSGRIVAETRPVLRICFLLSLSFLKRLLVRLFLLDVASLHLLIVLLKGVAKKGKEGLLQVLYQR